MENEIDRRRLEEQTITMAIIPDLTVWEKLPYRLARQVALILGIIGGLTGGAWALGSPSLGAYLEASVAGRAQERCIIDPAKVGCALASQAGKPVAIFNTAVNPKVRGSFCKSVKLLLTESGPKKAIVHQDTGVSRITGQYGPPTGLGNAAIFDRIRAGGKRIDPKGRIVAAYRNAGNEGRFSTAVFQENIDSNGIHEGQRVRNELGIYGRHVGPVSLYQNPRRASANQDEKEGQDLVSVPYKQGPKAFLLWGAFGLFSLWIGVTTLRHLDRHPWLGAVALLAFIGAFFALVRFLSGWSTVATQPSNYRHVEVVAGHGHENEIPRPRYRGDVLATVPRAMPIPELIFVVDIAEHDEELLPVVNCLHLRRTDLKKVVPIHKGCWHQERASYRGTHEPPIWGIRWQRILFGPDTDAQAPVQDGARSPSPVSYLHGYRDLPSNGSCQPISVGHLQVGPLASPEMFGGSLGETGGSIAANPQGPRKISNGDRRESRKSGAQPIRGFNEMPQPDQEKVIAGAIAILCAAALGAYLASKAETR